MKASWLGYGVAAAGLCLILVAAFIDLLGFGGAPGLGADQVLGIAGGWTLAILGLWLARFTGSSESRTRSRSALALSALVLWLLPIIVLAGGWLRQDRGAHANRTNATAEQTMAHALVSIGYLNWSENTADPSQSGLTRWNREAAQPGYTLISSRQRPEVYLIGMDGKVVHAWSLPGTAGKLEGARLLDNGDLIVISKFRELARLDWQSKVVWRTPIEAHHDVAVMPDGHLYTWVRDIRAFWGLAVQFPVLAKLSADGKILEGWSTFEHLDEIKSAFDQRSFLDRHLYSIYRTRIVEAIQGRLPADRDYDIFHANSAQLIGPNANSERPEFREGNLLICMRNVNQIATLDPATMEILWAWGEGEIEAPHHPTVLPNGNILIFDNGEARAYTRAIELNPVTEQIEWQYPANPDDPEYRFFSAYKGSAQRLENGNTLLADGENGRSVEVTREGEIVWEFFYPEINPQGYRAAIYRSLRYPEALVDDLIATRGANLSAAPNW